MKQFKQFNGVGTKLFLYVSIASLSSLLSDLSHYTCSHDHIGDITLVRWITIILNFLVQGLIAWRAFIDGTVERVYEREVQEEAAREHNKHHLKELH